LQWNSCRHSARQEKGSVDVAEENKALRTVRTDKKETTYQKPAWLREGQVPGCQHNVTVREQRRGGMCSRSVFCPPRTPPLHAQALDKYNGLTQRKCVGSCSREGWIKLAAGKMRVRMRCVWSMKSRMDAFGREMQMALFTEYEQDYRFVLSLALIIEAYRDPTLGVATSHGRFGY